MGVSGVPDIREPGQIREWPAASPGRTWLTRILVGLFFLKIRRVGQMPAGSRSAAQSAGGRKKDEIWDLVKNVEKVITKSGKATSEKRWVCKFCDRTLQGGPNIIMAHHGVHGSGKKKDVHRCRHTPLDVKARLEQEMSNTLRSVAEKGGQQRDKVRTPARRACSAHRGRGHRYKRPGCNWAAETRISAGAPDIAVDFSELCLNCIRWGIFRLELHG